MKVGDLVKISEERRRVYDRANQVGVVIRVADGCNGTLVLWQDGVSLFARPDFLQVINENLR